MSSKISVRAHAVITEGSVYRNCIVSYSPDSPSTAPQIVPFSTELQSTTSYNGIIIFAPLGYTLPPELDMPRATAAPGGFTDLLKQIADTVPACGEEPHTVILLPL